MGTHRRGSHADDGESAHHAPADAERQRQAHDLHAAGVGIGDIARILGISAMTARRQLKGALAEGADPPEGLPKALEFGHVDRALWLTMAAIVSEVTGLEEVLAQLLTRRSRLLGVDVPETQESADEHETHPDHREELVSRIVGIRARRDAAEGPEGPPG